VTVALLAGETVLLVLLSVLVVGLLRSHAEILRRIGPETAQNGTRDGAPGSR
jgi:formate hydrogenlyase subunit 4